MSSPFFEYIGRLCLSCGKVLNVCTPLNGSDPPQPGDVTICNYCSAILIFDTELAFRLPDEQEKRLIFKSMDDQFLIT